ncbi:hypothetical protein Acor_24670 [Acrocarpospora corrugata]|uniref:Uncharacterized protein n=1 Tax=Acrocarpospora corrugata TaxID=35763 RepID=A0A5M3VZ92_9ACTN|nr:hypothetical protein [Acrocarpospora corrugata]GES00403.1 hypothetical protein Acor_24670 [Acrocarpospora corrugata]
MIKRLILGPAVAVVSAVVLSAPAAAAVPPLTTAEVRAALLTTKNVGTGYTVKTARYNLSVPLKATYPTAACNKAVKM